MMRKRRWVLVLALLFLCVSLFFFWKHTAEQGMPAQATNSAQGSSHIQARPIQEDDHILAGKRGAPLTIVMYSDTECPFCKDFFLNSLPKLKKDYGSSVVFVYRHFPLPEHTRAKHEAEATECAYKLGGEDAFQRYIKRLYTLTRSDGTLDVSALSQIASDLGLDRGAFSSCLESGEMLRRVERDMQDGAFLGVYMTPSFFVDSPLKGVLMSGSNYSRLRATIEFVQAAQE